jgi:hypothetical protein
MIKGRGFEFIFHTIYFIIQASTVLVDEIWAQKNGRL